jgi:hypothetical protein
MFFECISSVFKQPLVYATNDLMVGGDKNNDDGEAVAHKSAKSFIKSPKLFKISFGLVLLCSKYAIHGIFAYFM